MTAPDKDLESILRSLALIRAIMPDERTDLERSSDFISVLRYEQAPVAEVLVGLATCASELVITLATMMRMTPEEFLQQLALNAEAVSAEDIEEAGDK